MSIESYHRQEALKLKPRDPITRSCHTETEIVEEILNLNDKHILELGCGSAQLTRAIASTGRGRQVMALEVDEIQHQKNLSLSLPNVRFGLGGAEQIPAEDASFDVVFLFRSLHHVPVDLMDQSLAEIYRVLKQGGYVYISEPICDGDFHNHILMLFHDEQDVRQAAFDAIQRAVKSEKFQCKEEVFFQVPRRFQNFEDFQTRVIGVTYMDHSLDDALLRTVQEAYSKFEDATGAAEFFEPMRVDLLQKRP